MMAWGRQPIESLCDVFADGDWIETKDQSEEGIRLIQTGNIGEGQFKNRLDKARYISEQTFEQLNCFEVLPGDCLVSRLPDPVGRACVIPDIESRAITSVDCTIIRFKSDTIYPEFFKYYSMSLSYLNDVDQQTSGATRKRISRKNLGKVKVPVPSMPEQKRIVAMLDEAFADIDRARELTEQNLKNARELFDSYLSQTFESRTKEWHKQKFGEVCHFVRGPFGGALKKSIFKPEGFAVYEQQHAIYDQFQDIRYFVDSEKFEQMSRFELLPGDLIISCSGTMGKIAIAPSNIRRGIINQALLKLTPKLGITAQFLKIWMESPNFQREIESRAQGAAIKNMASVKVLKDIFIPIPSEVVQHEIVDLHDRLKTLISSLESNYMTKLSELRKLKESILSQQFQGV